MPRPQSRRKSRSGAIVALLTVLMLGLAVAPATSAQPIAAPTAAPINPPNTEPINPPTIPTTPPTTPPSEPATQPTGAGPANPAGFRTRSVPAAAPVAVGIVNGKPQANSVRPLAATTYAPALNVELSQTELINYWYWAAGVTVTINGAWGNSRLVIQDFGPDGTLQKTFDPVYADSSGNATALLKADTNFPTPGVHTIRVTSSEGYLGVAPLTLLAYPGWTATVTTNPLKLSQTDWFAKNVVVTGKGFAPRERLTMHLFNPLGYGFAVGSALFADANGVFTYTLRSADVDAMPGNWNVTLISAAGTSGETTFTVTPSATRTKVGAVAMTPKKIARSAFENPGVAYQATGMKPFQAFRLTLRTAHGVEYVLGTFRANGEGRFGDLLTSYGDIPSGTYRLTMDSLNLRTYTAATFVVTEDDGFVAPNPKTTVVGTRISRLQAMDPDVGIRATGTHFTPDSLLTVEVRDTLNRRMVMSSSSITATTVGADGTVSFQLNPRKVPAAGTYSVHIYSDIYPAVYTSAALTITS